MERFNRELENLLKGAEAAPGELPEADRAALEVARKLTALDLSPNSAARGEFRRRLAAGSQPASRLTAVIAALRPASWTPLMIAAVLLIGWLYGSLVYAPGQQPGAGNSSPAAVTNAAFAPQPIQTPLASRQPATLSPSATISIRATGSSASGYSPTGAPHAAP